MTLEQWTSIKIGLRKNNEKAFEALYDCLWKKLYSVAFNFVRDKAISQEMVQDVFVSLWVKRGGLDDVHDINAFAIRAVQNRIYDYFDKKSVENRYILDLTRSHVRLVDSTQHQIEHDETAGLITTEIDKLPATTKKIFQLSRFERFSNQEIAADLNVSVKSVEYHITQALKRLRLRLGY
jgi:RNA polymerase sigma-70 factor (ECF subfamily)